MDTRTLDRIENNLYAVYGKEKGDRISKGIQDLMSTYRQDGQTKEWVDEKDVMLITYGDSIKSDGEKPLETLRKFLEKYVGDTISSVHLLPFYPYTSDDGFSVQDYLTVSPELGDWGMVHRLAEDYDLMFDAVINHISSKSDWFLRYLKGDPAFQDYFIESDPTVDYSSIVRPRALPLLTQVDHLEGARHVWTTFSHDQIDLNYRSEGLFLAVLEVLAQYVKHGARYLRLDAIGFLWKRLNTTSIHLEETHLIIQIMRDVLEEISPGTILITETNVPHEDNISYFGNGWNEAHMVYQFPLPPLTLHAFLSENAEHLSKWADALEPTSAHTSFFNFLASHDGVGLRPVEGILDEQEVQKMADSVAKNGGYVSYKDNGDGTKSPYELNINYFSALKREGDSDVQAVARFIAAQTILLSVKGMPGIYVHSLLGSENDQKGVESTGRYRSINREKLSVEQLEQEIQLEGSLREQIFNELMQSIKKRKSEKALHPNAEQKVCFLDARLFAILRTYEKTGDKLLALINVSGERVEISLDTLKGELGTDNLKDAIGEATYGAEEAVLQLEPYQAMWLKKN
ncbi:sugar phosphorylase [Salinicoccus sp. ID82-1]|uniref:sugar phosphorylase n=1 Tax=Salinicoccus sp. ID82-1 TaxID=2820269 RepID=UPI001F24447B|nr:sugar phosphorylase [Salinicoccus sp. ID82-1]MCG1009721.1 sugar phosphorylase [Salinicoccus sp. ID82-1]